MERCRQCEAQTLDPNPHGDRAKSVGRTRCCTSPREDREKEKKKALGISYRSCGNSLAGLLAIHPGV